MYKCIKKLMIFVFFCVSMAFSGYLGWSYANYTPQEEVNSVDIGENIVLAGGMPAGI